MDTHALIEYKGLYCRPDTSDKKMVTECLRNYSNFSIDTDSIVMDLGGNVGAFGKMALDAGCKELHVFEPDKSNVKMIRLNLGNHPNARNLAVYETAVSMSHDDSLTFFQTNSKNKDCSGTVTPSSARAESMRKNRYQVKNKNILEALDEINPTHLKIDIEGAEIEWIQQTEATIPDSVVEFSLEIHPNRDDFFTEFDSIWFPKLCEKFIPMFIHPNTGFKSPTKTVLPNMEIQAFGSVFGIDILFRRK